MIGFFHFDETKHDVSGRVRQQQHSQPLSGPAWNRWRVALEAVFAALAGTPILLFLVASAGRLRYPFPLEQLEGPMLLAAERVAQGLPVYVRPNFHFIPYMYAPAYYYVSGWAVRLLGPGFTALRLVSSLSTLGAFVLIYFLVLLDTPGTRKRRHLAALAGAAIYAATYPWTREWFDLGRVDSLYIFLLLLALLATRRAQERLHPVFAAAAWTLAFLAKQTILPIALILLCADWKRPRRTLFGVASFVAMVAASLGWLNRATDGWFWFYAFTVPHANTDLLLRPAVFYIPSQIVAPFGAALLIIAIAWSRRHGAAADPGRPDRAARFYRLAIASTFALCWFLQAHGGATANTPMPVYAVLAIAFGISFGRLDAAWALEVGREPARVFLLAVAAIPLLSWVYNPRDMIPRRALLTSKQELVAWLRIFPGDVFLPADPYDAVAAGKPWHPDVAALHDALRADLPGIRQPLIDRIRARIDGEKFDVIALDDLPASALAGQTWLPSDLQNHYPVLGLIPGAETGDPFRPHPVYFLLPCRERALAAARGWTLLETAHRPPCPNSTLATARVEPYIPSR